MIEANPRASRTVPFVAKATGVPLAKVAARVMLGATLAELRAEGLLRPPVVGGHVAVKEAVLPFNRFPDVDTALGPEMRSTGEVMGIDATFGLAFAKSQTAAGTRCPSRGHGVPVAGRPRQAGRAGRRPGASAELGLSIVATEGTARLPRTVRRCPVDAVVSQGVRGQGDITAVDLIAAGKVDLVVNTPVGPGAPGRRLPDPPGRHRAQGELPHDHRRRAGRRGRHRRTGPAPTRASARCRSTTRRHRRQLELCGRRST